MDERRRRKEDHPVGEGDGTFRFLEDQGVGPPLWDTPDSSRVYQLHGRARFDTWRRNYVGFAMSAESSDCEALVAVVVGCNVRRGARPTDMGWDIYPASGATRWRPRAGTGSRGAPTW